MAVSKIIEYLASVVCQPFPLFGAIIVYCIGLATRRLLLSPIAHVPGPKFAALTLLYEFYYDVILRGQYTFKLAELHQQFGPIIRINPYEVHIDDPDYYEEIYTGAAKQRDKWSWPSKIFGIPGSSFATLHHDLHRLRRAPLNPFFSKKSIVALEPILVEQVDKLSAKLACFGDNEPVNLRPAFSALAMDIIMIYAFGRSENCLDQPSFAHGWDETTYAISMAAHCCKHLPWTLSLIQALPSRLVNWLDPRFGRLLRLQKDVTEQVASILANDTVASSSSKEYQTIFHELISTPLLPASEKVLDRISDEGQSLIAAAEITTTNYLTTTLYHILANPHILHKLQAEFKAVMPDSDKLVPCSQLEQLPYLSAVIKEGHRVSYGIPHRLQRICPDTPLQYREYNIPAGTPVSMSCKFMHDNPVHFPDPATFDPNRWLQPDSKRLEKYLVPFSKGSRGCLGQELAQAEIHLTLAALIRRFDFEIYKTEREDIDMKEDHFNPQPRKGSLGLRVLVKGSG